MPLDPKKAGHLNPAWCALLRDAFQGHTPFSQDAVCPMCEGTTLWIGPLREAAGPYGRSRHQSVLHRGEAKLERHHCCTSDADALFRIKRFRWRGVVVVCRSCGFEFSFTYRSAIRALERVRAGKDLYHLKYCKASGESPEYDESESEPNYYLKSMDTLLALLQQVAPEEQRGGAGGTMRTEIRELYEEAKNLPPSPKRPGPPT